MTLKDFGHGAKFANDSIEMWPKAVESFVDKVAVVLLAIVDLENPDTRFTEVIAQSIKREIDWHALKNDNIRIISFHLVCRFVVVGCSNTLTKEWRKERHDAWS